MSEKHYYSNYADTRDIDCFCKAGTVACHFASNGQPIPSFITRKTNMLVQDAVYGLLENVKEDVWVDYDEIRQLIQKELDAIEGFVVDSVDIRTGIEAMVQDYAKSFIEMAQLGFVSMDLDEEGRYHVVAKPKGQKVPDEIFSLLPEVEEDIFGID